MQLYEKTAVCPYDCPDSCGMVAVTDGTKIYSVKGDPNHPVTKGFLCRKMQQYEKDIHSPHRISTPLKRVGEKGSGSSFAPISWEEAIQEIGDRWKAIIKEYGSDSILPYSYAGTLGTIQRNCGEAFFARLGAAHLERTICSSAKGSGASFTMGTFCDWHSDQIASSDLILLWGCNPKVNRIHIVPPIQAAKKAGAKVILVDLYETASSDLCDETLIVRPGTDATLLLAVMYELYQNQWLDEAFLEKYTTGFRELKEEFMGWNPERAKAVCSVPEKTIRRLAKSYGTAKRPIIVAGSGMSRYTNGGAAFRLLLCLPALVGAWERGGGTSSFMGSGSFFNKDQIRRPDFERPGLYRVNMNQLGDALLKKRHSPSVPYQIQGLYVYHSNPAVMAPDQNKVLKGLRRDDLFCVVHDRFLTDTALYADIVLPATFSVEHDDIYSSYGHYHAQVGWKIIEPYGESKSNWDTFRLLAAQMGFTDDYFKPSAKEMVTSILDHALSGEFFRFPITREQVDALRYGRPILLPQADVMDFKTSDGKIHLKPQSPAYVPLEDKKYPLRLVMGHSPWAINSNFSYREELMEKRGSLTLLLNAEDAEKRGIKNGETCRAYNNYGSITVQAHVTQKIPPGTVIAQGVYQKQYTFGDGNFSALLSQKLTDYGAASSLNTQTVELQRIANETGHMR